MTMSCLAASRLAASRVSSISGRQSDGRSLRGISLRVWGTREHWIHVLRVAAVSDFCAGHWQSAQAKAARAKPAPRSLPSYPRAVRSCRANAVKCQSLFDKTASHLGQQVAPALRLLRSISSIVSSSCCPAIAGASAGGASPGAGVAFGAVTCLLSQFARLLDAAPSASEWLLLGDMVFLSQSRSAHGQA